MRDVRSQGVHAPVAFGAAGDSPLPVRRRNPHEIVAKAGREHRPGPRIQVTVVPDPDAGGLPAVQLSETPAALLRRHAHLSRIPATAQFILQEGIYGIQRSAGAFSLEMDIGPVAEILKGVVPTLPVFRSQDQPIPDGRLHGNWNPHTAHLLQPNLQLLGGIAFDLRGLAVQDDGIGGSTVLKQGVPGRTCQKAKDGRKTIQYLIHIGNT